MNLFTGKSGLGNFSLVVCALYAQVACVMSVFFEGWAQIRIASNLSIIPFIPSWDGPSNKIQISVAKIGLYKFVWTPLLDADDTQAVESGFIVDHWQFVRL